MTTPTPVLTPRLVCSPASEAIEFYKKVFGAEEIERYAMPNGNIVHAAISIRGAVVAITDAAPDWQNVPPGELGGSPVILTLDCADPDATAKLAIDNGAAEVFPIADQFYGHREGRIRDPFGHLWILSRIDKKMSAEEIQRGIDQFGG